MEYQEFRRHVGKAGLTMAAFARVIGVTPNTVTNYSRQGTVPRLYAITAVLMGDAADRGIDFRRLLQSHVPPLAGEANVADIEAYRVRRRGR